MLNNYLPDDICKIIRNKVSLDFVKYRFWCCTEGKWVYLWTSCDLVHLKCPNEYNHDIYLDFIKIVSRINSNGKILLFDKTTKIDTCITQTDFETINI